jgi:hypothetical protein
MHPVQLSDIAAWVLSARVVAGIVGTVAGIALGALILWL